MVYSRHDPRREGAAGSHSAGRRSRARDRVRRCLGHPAALAIGSRAPSPAAGGARRVRQHQGNGGRRAPDLGRLQRSRGGALGAGLAARRCCIFVCNAACGRGLAAGRELEQGLMGHEGSFAGPDDRGPAARSVAAGCHYRRQIVDGNQLPSRVDVPTPGCWSFVVAWIRSSRQTSTIDLDVLPPGTLPTRPSP